MGFMYLRINDWCKSLNILKMGITANFTDRNGTYITSEPKPGEFILVIAIPLDKMHTIDILSKIYFKKHNYYKLGGKEYFYECIKDELEPYLQQIGVEYKVLTNDEVHSLNRTIRLRTICDNLNVKNIIKKLVSNIIKTRELKKINKLESNTIAPNEHQNVVLNNIEEFYKVNKIGKLIWACGLGKSLLSILMIKLLKFKTIVFGVSSISLQSQMVEDIRKIFPKHSNILCIGGDKIANITFTTNKEQIKLFLNSDETRFIITTYHSCNLLVDKDIIVDFKIGDEAHHLVGIEKDNEKGFVKFHDINSKKSMFMTATEKSLCINTNKIKFSMDDELIFGKYIDEKSVQWAIEHKKITDYNILILKNTEADVNDIILKLGIEVCNKDLFISSFMTLKSLEKYKDITHLFIYTNTTSDAELANVYITKILDLNILSFSKDDVYNKALHSKNCKTSNDVDLEKNNFIKSKYGIISCVYLFGEGVNIPKLNGVCIASNMQSEIRIVQYLLRPNRLNLENPNKMAYIIIPYIDSILDTTPYEKVRNIITQMRTVDETIEQKLFVYNYEPVKPKKINIVIEATNIITEYNLNENAIELDKFKLRLRYSKTLNSKCTEEQDEYNYVKAINKSLNIDSTEKYNQSQNERSHFISNPVEYFKAKGVWINWYDFMGTDTTKFIQTKDEWKKFCKKLNIKSVDDYEKACELNINLPIYPEEIYKDYTGNLQSELEFNIRRR